MDDTLISNLVNALPQTRRSILRLLLDEGRSLIDIAVSLNMGTSDTRGHLQLMQELGVIEKCDRLYRIREEHAAFIKFALDKSSQVVCDL